MANINGLVQVSTADVSAPASNTAAVVTYAADTNGEHALGAVHWSYSSAPTAGNLKVEDGSGNVVFTTDITAAGPGFEMFNFPKLGSKNTAMIVTLATGGAGVTGKLSCTHWLVSVI